MFKKKIIQIPAEGFTGQTVKHKVTAKNLEDFPQLATAGKNVGDEIDIMDPETLDADGNIIKLEKALNTPQDTGKPATVKKEEKPDSSKAQEKRAAEIAEKFNVEVVHENIATGDFFISENLALLSVGQNKTKLKTHNF